MDRAYCAQRIKVMASISNKEQLQRLYGKRRDWYTAANIKIQRDIDESKKQLAAIQHPNSLENQNVRKHNHFYLTV